MPKKKKKSTRTRSTRKTKEVAPEHELPGGFWRQVIAILMIAISIVLIMTWFGSGYILTLVQSAQENLSRL